MVVSQKAALRLIDANANRALEGMRVCEEIVRFHLKRPRVFHRIRSLRHDIAGTVRRLPVTHEELMRSRESRRDLGRELSGSRVQSIERLLLINCQRVKEALRTLEECTRLIAPAQTASFQRLRFRTYDVEREVLLSVAALRHH